MKKKFLLISINLIITLQYNLHAQSSPVVFHKEPTEEKVLVFDDFEDKSTFKTWNGSISLSDEFPSHGKTSLKLFAPGWQPLLLESERIPKDWKGFDCLKFDIYNPSSALQFGTIQIFDDLATDTEAEINGQRYIGSGKLFMTKGWNHFEFLLEHVMVEEGNRALALDKIRKLRFTFSPVNHPFFIDNIRLTAGKENNQTASFVDPASCRVVIDNRYVYPTLAGPEDQLVISPEIKNLREQANTAVEILKNTIRVADMQGLQTLYQRIALITADVGLGIRSKLVWFQNEEDEKNILDYVIKSCREATKEIEDKLFAHRTGIVGWAPEDFGSTSEQYRGFNVPPLPLLKELKPNDGYMRDKNGNPVILFSMLGIQNKGPLTDYFVPNDHLMESFTVGGGSRYNIESSPVYNAFHKYADAKRVGWDGWCGHLIKDRWAMGGKKETVVICLESPHIRAAVQEYIKIHYKEWKENPNLLYNIMGYELQYICYCDKSQQMFRNWLKTKYHNINVINQNWKTHYKYFDEIKAPETHNARPLDDVNRAAWYDWATFNTRRFTDYLKWVKAEMRKLDPTVPICAGGTFSMLNSSNSVSGIDEEMIIKEVDDVIVNESGSSPIFSDLLSSLSEKKKVMFDPEMGWGTHGILLQFLHGKADISKWWWSGAPSKEFPEMNQSSIPHSKNTSLADIAEVLRLGLDVRRLSSEIAAFTKDDPEVAILYSKTSSLQVPPQQIQAGNTPYIDAVYSVWEGARFLGCRIGFVSEKQILDGRLKKFKLLIVPAAKYMRPEVITAIKNYIKEGGTALIIPESFMFNQFAQENNKISEFGIKITGVTLPPVLGTGEKVQNYDQSFSQQIIYADVTKKITTLNKDIFADYKIPLILNSNGLVQTIAAVNHNVIARFDDGKPAIIRSEIGKGAMYYLASPLKSEDYHRLLSPLAQKLNLKRPLLAVDQNGDLITGVEVRAVERDNDYLVYASNLKSDTIIFSLRGEKSLGIIRDLRSLQEITNENIKLNPYQETIFIIKKDKK